MNIDRTPSTMPDRELSPPDGGEQTPADERRVQERVRELMQDAAFWSDEMEGLEFSRETCAVLADCMQYVLPAYKEMSTVVITQCGSTLVILQALMRLHAMAKARAEREAGDE